ncbi:MAG: High-affinity branched-chain amino acid transport system permease protein LivH [Burkholderiaceae bacterium]|jgi:branched-chain amino acid transport system permease protein|uniref:Branched-chain amino acid ABC transporter permease n=1 Tax=Piscinibacter koreensis TaxID=2742824 RepID=A0A7Y6NNJ4_9BURK|nr:branched-chain amino acid ABC transporter permease [Schlegelella koreensis]MCG3190460.1 High-affinity branched-chain amino acid transport system permease protein LivH [Burkholderiaceae bacterium]MDX9741946.1 branched-chain amino acid ABC transporter permease [Gammaproteobacteria bacterium]NBP83995.1 branched-chain amino acid ABC transporter permease [Mycobacteriaceae bacterium]NBQ41299.1 branched-chain amino acid ABC transporter permease [Mycobacteriaceae bacterium]NUZ06352.1 branched-chain
MALTLIGLSIGLLLFLVAAGLTLIFGLLGVINFAHGAFYMLGAYIGYQAVASTGSFWLALALTPLIVLPAGALLERVLLRPLYAKPHAQQLVMTFGLILVMEEAARMVWGLGYLRVSPPAALAGTTEIFGSYIGDYRIFACVVAAVVAAGLLLGLERTSLGATIRAAAANPRMLSCLGADVNRLRMWTFGGGTALAAFAGVLVSPLVPIDSGMAITVITDCFVVIVVGGLGNARGAIAASLLVGLLRAFGQQFAAEWVDVATYGLLIFTLLIRPAGLFNQRTRTA